MPKNKKKSNRNKEASAGDEVEFDNPLNDAEVTVFDADVAEEGSATVFDAEDGAGVEGESEDEGKVESDSLVFARLAFDNRIKNVVQLQRRNLGPDYLPRPFEEIKAKFHKIGAGFQTAEKVLTQQGHRTRGVDGEDIYTLTRAELGEAVKQIVVLSGPEQLRCKMQSVEKMSTLKQKAKNRGIDDGDISGALNDPNGNKRGALIDLIVATAKIHDADLADAEVDEIFEAAESGADKHQLDLEGLMCFLCIGYLLEKIPRAGYLTDGFDLCLETFWLLDADNDGQIDKAELQEQDIAAFRHSRFSELDRDDNGFISFAEFLHGFMAWVHEVAVLGEEDVFTDDEGCCCVM